ncbi:MAG: CNNM domain-containing protein [Pirellulaceae bacterium]
MSWLIAILLLLGGLLLSAFFSGSETGFYRATRVRMLLDALDGDAISRGLLWLANNPALFVATTLVGNNVANYIVSLAIVLITHLVLGQGQTAAEMLAPVIFAPVVFVYGESLPKNLYYHAPNRLLRLGGPLFLFCLVLFSPIAGMLWLLGRLLQILLGEAPERVKLKLARKEVEQVLLEGQEAGIIKPAQHRLAQNLFAVANRPVTALCTPLARAASVRIGSRREDVLRLARRHRQPALPVIAAKSRDLVGYVRVIDLYLDPRETIDEVRPLLKVSAGDTHVTALIAMETSKEELAQVVDAKGVTIGLLYAEQLNEPLFR